MKIRRSLIAILLVGILAFNGFAAPAFAATNYSYNSVSNPVVMFFLNNLKYLMPNRDARLHTIIHSAAIEAGGIGLATAQIPGDRFVIGAVQLNMVIEIASEFGEEIDKSYAIAIIQTALATFIGVEVFNGVIKYAPGIGNLANMGTASSVTETIGWTTVGYFNNRTS